MILQPRLSLGLALGVGKELQRQVSSYCELAHSGVHVFVPFVTPPSASIVAPLLTWQACPGGPAKHVSVALASVSTPLG
jgi:hypothetical protein